MKGKSLSIAGVVKLADTQDLKSCGRYARSGSSPDLRILRLLEVRKKTSPTSSVVAFSIMKFHEAHLCFLYYTTIKDIRKNSMNKNLSRLANASAGNKEESIFKVYAYLNTKFDFSPLLISQKVLVKNNTILKYLDTIRKAQLNSTVYRNRINNMNSVDFCKGMNQEQKEIAEKSLEKWKKDVSSFEKGNELHDHQLDQYIHPNDEQKAELFFSRLEQSLLIYTFLLQKK